MKVTTTITYIGQPFLKRLRGDKRQARKALSEELRPSPGFLRLLGEVMREGFRGGYYPTSLVFGKRGGISFGGERMFPRGIKRGVSPDGKAYEDLAETTLKKKRQESSPYVDDPLMRRAEADRMALRNSLVVNVRGNNVQLMFRDASMNKRSRVHEEGRSRYWSEEKPFFNRKTGARIYVPIPARPHRQIQPKVSPVLTKLIHDWTKKAYK
jgi:hypothetical protein